VKETTVQNLVPIGRFSRVSQLTVKALRHYDELGLLRPAAVDPQSGYRYYALTQAAEAERIGLLRAAGMPLEDIRDLLRAATPEERRARLEAHRRHLATQLAGVRDALGVLDDLLDERADVASYPVIVKQVAEQHVLSIRERTPMTELARAAASAFPELIAYLDEVGVRPAGQPFAVYHDEDLRDEVDLELVVPTVKHVAGRGRMDGRLLPAATLAATLHCGPYPTIGKAYRALAAWMLEHGHESAGGPRETYLLGPAMVHHPNDLRTEAAWPIRAGGES
jgi:DNA-binding transcriptional MerR regulator